MEKSTAEDRANEQLDPTIQHVDVTGFVADLQDLPDNYYYSRFFIGSFVASGFAMLAGVSAFAYAAPLLGDINADIGPNPNYIWISYVYNTAIAVTFPIVGRLSDLFGRRYYFIGGAVLATIGSIICARAQTIPTLIGGNVFLGVATAPQLSYHFFIGELVPLRFRYISSAVLYLFCYPGSGFGPAVGNALISNFPETGWRGVYYLILAYNVTALALSILFYFPPSFKVKHGNDSKMHWIKNFDYVGAFLFISGFVVFLFGISIGGTQYPWKSAAPISMIILGFLTLCAFAAWEYFRPSPESLAPPHIFHLRWVSAAVTLGLAASVYYTAAIIWPQQVSVLYADGDKIYAGLLSTLPGLGNISGEVVGGPIATRLPRHRLQTIIAFIAGGTLTGCCAIVNLSNKAALASFVFLANFCMGWVEVICLSSSTIVIDNQQEIGVAGGLAAAIRTALSAISTVVYGTVLSNQLSSKVPEAVGPAVIESGLPPSSVANFIQALTVGTSEALSRVPGVTDAIIVEGTHAYKLGAVRSYRTVYLVSIAFTAVGAVTSFFSPDTERHFNSKIAATLGDGNVGYRSETGIAVGHDKGASSQ